MLYLIDGYNLLHALGLLPKQTAPGGLHHARLRLLALLRDALGDEARRITVVFDAARAPVGATEVQDYHGIVVRFAIHEKQADDLIELLIRGETLPHRLTVVSDDQRIQQAARRRKCPVLGCAAFLDWLDQQRQPHRQPGRENVSKPQRSTAAEAEHWLRVFAELGKSPEMKEAFNPFDFESDEQGSTD